MPGNWYSKRQATVENATYGSEFVAAKTATEQIVDIRQTLRNLGVPIKSNEETINSICDMIYIKTQVFRLLRYYSPAPRNIARSDWAAQNITHNMTSSIMNEKGNFNYALHKPHKQKELQGITHHYIFCTVTTHLYISFNRKLWMS